MADEPSEPHELTIERLFPWVRLFRAVGVAIDAKKLFLAALGLIVFSLGRGGLDGLFSRSETTLNPAPGRSAGLNLPVPDLSPSLAFSPPEDLAMAPWRMI